MEQIKYNSDIHKEIIDFNYENFPLRKNIEESFIDRFTKNPYSSNAIDDSQYIIDNNKVFGQFLVIPTVFHHQNKEYSGVWGVDFILDEALKGKNFGRNLGESIFKLHNYYGVGASDVSLRIHLKNGNHIIGYGKRFIKFNSIFSPLRLFFPKKTSERKDIIYPEKVTINNSEFKRIYDTKNWEFNKFWNSDYLEWDRSKEFIDWRFLLHENKYAVYVSKDCYFVVRQVKWRKLNALILVDYRYNSKSPERYSHILKALKKISKKSNSDAIIGFSTIKVEQEKLKKQLYFNFGRDLEIMTNCIDYKYFKNVFVTMADTDLDHFYGDNIW